MFWKRRKKKKKGTRWFRRLVFFLMAYLLLLMLVVLVLFLRAFFQHKILVSPIPSKEGNSVVVSKETKTQKEIADLLKKNAIQYLSISEEKGDTARVLLSNGGEVIFSLKKNLSVQVSSLQLITSRLTIEGKRFTRLDLQYNQPVIIFDK